MKIYHNPRCGKSRAALKILNDRGIEPEIILYLNDVPTEKMLAGILKKLKMKAFDLVRKNEAVYKEKFKGKELSEQQWIKAMIENPKLIERPILIEGSSAIVARPTELAESFGNK